MSAPRKPTDQQEVPERAPETALEAPKVPMVLDELDEDKPIGLLPLRALGQDLDVTFMGWDFTVAPNRTDRVELGFMPFGSAFVSVNGRLYPSQVPVPLPQTLTVPKELLKQGVYEVSIRVSPSLVNPAESPRTKITIDTTKPNFGNPPLPVIFPPELNGTITEADLESTGQVIVEAPFYIDVEWGDRAVYFWTDQAIPPDSEIEIREQEFSQQDIDNNRLLITVYADEIRAWGPGTRYMYYYLRDRAGNIGPRARLQSILVDLTPLPGALPPPRVPLPRNLIDRQQARESVHVEIDAYEFPDAAHWVAIDWDGTPLAEIPVDPAAFPLKATVPWPVLQALGDGPLRALVSYRVRHADGSYTAPSPEISVAVNLTIAGQDHANAPALLNETLAKLEVRGQRSDLPNKLLGIDFGLPARALLVLFDDPQPFQWIDVYWGQIDTPVVSYEVQVGDVAGKPIELEILWEYIEPELQNPRLATYYVTRNGVNDQHASVTEVDVAIVIIDDLKEPTFPHGGKAGVLNCCAVPRLWEGVTVRIAAHPAFSALDEVVLYWQGCRGPNGTSPIAGTYAELSKTLSAADAVNGFDLVVADYETLIAPMVNNGSGLAYYVLNKRGGGVGESKSDFVIINRTMPSGEVCSPTNETCAEPVRRKR
ncbi:hypothetical protein SAMN04487857_104336 [Pseudomonas sp. ok272]|uniref:hypothetical protein n=1 Tax=unclassified Pseudomonas TaxID=196821 RepID=UPI0008CB8954|nr:MULTISPECIES: hypothetical protein [unclassified Pseudomonas]SEM74320.1 hypothetical protein SAMN04487857_104336 [Pseudomonas sp. ok272]SFM63066.1 hypothetical protein SAMN04487858_104336 [Pseudomonas sp. ok602]